MNQTGKYELDMLRSQIIILKADLKFYQKGAEFHKRIAEERNAYILELREALSNVSQCVPKELRQCP